MFYFLKFLNWTYLGIVAPQKKRTRGNLLSDKTIFYLFISAYDTGT